jgi:hypothetical protein
MRIGSFTVSSSSAAACAAVPDTGAEEGFAAMAPAAQSGGAKHPSNAETNVVCRQKEPFALRFDKDMKESPIGHRGSPVFECDMNTLDLKHCASNGARHCLTEPPSKAGTSADAPKYKDEVGQSSTRVNYYRA